MFSQQLLLQLLHIEVLCFWKGVSGQQISSFALQIGDLPFHPSSAAAAVAKEMLPVPCANVYFSP